MRRLRIILQSRYIIKIMSIIVIVIDIIFLHSYIYKSKYNSYDNIVRGIITDIKLNKDKVSIIVKDKELVIANYYYNEEEVENIYNLELGDIIELEGVLEEVNNNTIPNLFNYKEYLYIKGIYYVMNVKSITKIKNNENILYWVKNKVRKRIERIDKSSSYLKTFILGDKSDINDKVIESYQINGVSHLFSISGMHVSLFAGIIMLFLKRVSYNLKFNYGIVIIFLIFYMFLVNFTSSILRTVMMYLVSGINKVFNLKIRTIDLALLSLIFLIIIKPRIILDMGFQFSYLVSFTLILFTKKINNKKNYFIKLLYVSFVSFLVSIPICIVNFYQVNIISIILNIFLVPLVSLIVFPLSLITFVIPVLDNILYLFIKLIEIVNLYVTRIDIGVIGLAKIPVYIVFLYYIVIYLVLYNYKYLGILIVIIGFHKNINYFNSSQSLIMLDVGQGDSIFMKLPYNKGNILIDTGGNTWGDYSIADNRIIPYFKSIGIVKLDYIIVTHGDFDHMGEAINLVENFKVEKVIFNCGPYNELETELIKVLDKKKIPYYSCIEELNIDDNKLYFLNNKIYDNENDNSSVIYTELNDYKFLFMGDAGVEVEEDLIEKYNIQDIDVLKVGHHGSKTSSDKKFINEINPKYSVISVGKNNRYGHPNDSVLNNLDDSKIYRTDDDGSIMFQIKNNKLEINTCSP